MHRNAFCHTFYVIDNFPVEALLGYEFLNPHECRVSYAAASRLGIGQPTCPTCIVQFAAYGRARTCGSQRTAGIPLVPLPPHNHLDPLLGFPADQFPYRPPARPLGPIRYINGREKTPCGTSSHTAFPLRFRTHHISYG